MSRPPSLATKDDRVKIPISLVRIITTGTVPTFARTGTGKWHVVGPDGCRYGRSFTEADTKPAETITATDIVTYEPPPEPDDVDAVADALSERGFLGGSTGNQRLVFPQTVRESDGDCCTSCRTRLEEHMQRRAAVISNLKQVTPTREVEWTVTDHDDRRACDWCRARELTTWASDTLGAEVCPACGRLFESPLGEPDDDSQPKRDRLPETPTESVTPIVFGTTLPEYDPTELVGSNRPLIKYREKSKYADVVCELERTGHGFSADGLDALDAIRERYAAQVADDDSHQTDVTLSVGRTPRTVTIAGLGTNDGPGVIEECIEVVSDPAYWVPLGWPQQGAIHRRAADPSIPGDDPVVDAFPRLRTQGPDRSVDVESIRRVTGPGRFERGERYYERGAVTDIERVDDQLEATVQGSRPYEVRVTFAGGSYAEGQCDCPDDTIPCKHIVAAVLASGDVPVTGGEQPLEELLATASPATLRQVCHELADEDVSVRKRLYEELGRE